MKKRILGLSVLLTLGTVLLMKQNSPVQEMTKASSIEGRGRDLKNSAIVKKSEAAFMQNYQEMRNATQDAQRAALNDLVMIQDAYLMLSLNKEDEVLVEASIDFLSKALNQRPANMAAINLAERIIEREMIQDIQTMKKFKTIYKKAKS